MSEHEPLITSVPANTGFIRIIEGMRAVAVLAVSLFHLDLPGFVGGFLGVQDPVHQARTSVWELMR